jgi:hypothetical protein
MNNGAQYGPKNYNRDLLTADLSRYAITASWLSRLQALTPVISLSRFAMN